MRVEIKIRRSNKNLNSLASFMEQSEVKIFETETISFDVTDASPWLTEQRKIDFGKKLNEEFVNKFLHEVVSISVIN